MQVGESRLEPWEHAFCELMAQRTKALPKTKQAEAASLLAGFPVSVQEVTKLRDRRAYRVLLYALKSKRQEVLDEARSIFLDGAPKAAALQVRAVEEMMDQPAGKLDIRAVPQVTAPFIERFWEKKQHVETTQTTVTITITANQQAALDADPIDVEFEEVTTEQVP
jgi:hypothetical protein